MISRDQIKTIQLNILKPNKGKGATQNWKTFGLSLTLTFWQLQLPPHLSSTKVEILN